MSFSKRSSPFCAHEAVASPITSRAAETPVKIDRIETPPYTLSEEPNTARLQRRIDPRPPLVSTLSFYRRSMAVIRNHGGPHDPQGTRRMAWNRPRRQRRSFD